jgi:hypothetical protein
VSLPLTILKSPAAGLALPFAVTTFTVTAELLAFDSLIVNTNAVVPEFPSAFDTSLMVMDSLPGGGGGAAGRSRHCGWSRRPGRR